MKQFKKQPAQSKKDLLLRILLYAIGVGIMPAGAVLTINSHFGAGGVDAFCFIAADLLRVPTSYAVYGIALIVVLITACIRRSFPRFTTFVASFFMGLSTDFWKAVLTDVQGSTLLSRLIILLIGLVIISFAVAAYMCSGFPTNPHDDFVVALHEKGVSIRAAKIAFDLFHVAAAFLLGGEIGVGTILCTFTMGPIIDFFHRILLCVPAIQKAADP